MRTVGWELRLASLAFDKPNEFSRRVSAFVAEFCISHKHPSSRFYNENKLVKPSRAKTWRNADYAEPLLFNSATVRTMLSTFAVTFITAAANVSSWPAHATSVVGCG
jgi:hypothetical protein